MPQVGSKHFPYTPSGYAAAAKARAAIKGVKSKLAAKSSAKNKKKGRKIGDMAKELSGRMMMQRKEMEGMMKKPMGMSK